MDREEALRRLRAAYFSDAPHERDAVSHLGELLRGARLFVDVGASLGQYTREASRSMRGGRIVAIEADAMRWGELERTSREWAASSGVVIDPLQAAASDDDGETTFYTTRSEVSGGLFPHRVPPGHEVSWERVPTKCVRLDTLLGGDDPDLVKIDVEGSELRVLRGADAILRRGRTRFLVEVHGWGDRERGTGPWEVVRFMARRGYVPAWFFGSVLFAKPSVSWAAWAVRGAPAAALRVVRALLRSR